jgi:hypothetical protein
MHGAARRVLLGASFAFLLVRLSGCSSSPSGGFNDDDSGSTQDGTADGAHRDSSTDAGRDVISTDGANGGSDGAADSTADAPVESAADAPVDSAMDAPVDSAPDAPADSGTDTSVDSAADAAVDSATDAAIDSATKDADAASTGSALAFTGAGYVEAASAFALPSGDFTLEVWVYPTSWPSGEMQILAKDQNAVQANQYRLGIDSGGNVFFMASDASGNGVDFYNNAYVLQAQLTVNTWAHLAVTRSGSAFTLYVGSASMATTTSTLALSGGSNPFRIGARVSQSGSSAPDTDNFQGIIDDVRVWNAARTSAQIVATMSQALDPAANPSLVANWRFDDGSGTTAADSTGSFPGTLHVSNSSPSWTTMTAY